MRKFDLYVSRNFKGGEYFTSFNASTIDEFNRILILMWHSLAITPATSEVFINTDIEYEGRIYPFEVGCYVVRDNEIEAFFNQPSEESAELICESLVDEFEDINDDFTSYQQIIKALLS